jgi:DNA-binding CsgD family transcriptional regulator
MEVLRLLRTLISFDGAVMGIGYHTVTMRHELIAEQTIGDDKQDELLVPFVKEGNLCPIAKALTDGLLKPLSLDCHNSSQKRELLCINPLRTLVPELSAKKILIFGDHASDRNARRWIVLFRSDENAFTDIEATCLQTYWRHAVQALAMNLSHTLHGSDPDLKTRALALVNSCGIVEIADAELTELIQCEWSGLSGRSLPLYALKSLLDAGVYRGKRIEISASLKAGYLACSAKPISSIHVLSPSERKVAHCFANGMTHSQIASHLNVSPNTVRNQLAQVYQKLGIHRKTELARMVSDVQQSDEAATAHDAAQGTVASWGKAVRLQMPRETLLQQDIF